ncbi:MAG: hypothetical protein AB8F94_08265 [Saprospiraceae bacterium]
MNYFKITIFIFSLAFVFSNCTGNESTPTEESINSICDCTQPVVEINQKIKTLQVEGNIEAITALVEKAGIAFDEAIKCTQKNASDKVDKIKLKKALMSNCKVEERMIDDLIKKL